MEKEDKPFISRRVAAVLSIFIIAALVLAFYFLFWRMRATTNMAGINPNVQAPQPNLTEDKWVLSPLVGKYGIRNTPILVINCRYMLTGSFALNEESGALAQGTERNNLGNALCAATHDTAFCSKFGGAPKGLATLNFDECKSGSKILIYAFHNPYCAISTAQRDFLDALKNEFPDKIDLQYICYPTSDLGIDACSRDFLIKKYNA